LARRIRARSNWFTFHIPRGRIYCAVAIRANRPPDRLQLSCILGLTWISFPTDLIDDARLLVTHVSNRNGAFAANRAAPSRRWWRQRQSISKFSSFGPQAGINFKTGCQVASSRSESPVLPVPG
jgi:hypothetical protein